MPHVQSGYPVSSAYPSTLTNPNHHLWCNHGTWFTSYTIYPTRLTKERIRHSLKTKCLETARRRRDLVLARLHADGVLALPRTEVRSGS